MIRTGAALATMLLSLCACAGESLRGTITSVDADDRLIVINGESYVVPHDVTVDWPDLDPGTQVLIRYQDDGGRKAITVIEPESTD